MANIELSFQSSTGNGNSSNGKAKSATKSPITKFFPPKAAADGAANGASGGGSSTPSKKRKSSGGGGAGTPKTPKSPDTSGFKSFCRANRTRVS